MHYVLVALAEEASKTDIYIPPHFKGRIGNEKNKQG
jgi:hypothetical protein